MPNDPTPTIVSQYSPNELLPADIEQRMTTDKIELNNLQ